MFEPKWKNKDWRIRSKAVKSINDNDLLLEIAKTDSDWHVRASAVEMINDEEALLQIALSDPDDDVKICAIEKIGNEQKLLKIADSDLEKSVKSALNKKLGIEPEASDTPSLISNDEALEKSSRKSESGSEDDLHFDDAQDDEVTHKKESAVLTWVKKVGWLILAGAISFVIYSALLVGLSALVHILKEQNNLEMSLFFSTFVKLVGLVFVGSWAWLYGIFVSKEKPKVWGKRLVIAFFVISILSYASSFLIEPVK